MNESLKIGVGIFLGFILLGGLFLLFVVYNNDEYNTVLETDNVFLEQSPEGDFYTARIKARPQTAKQEVYNWLEDKYGPDQEKICERFVVFIFSDNINEEERKAFEPRFSGCSL